MRPVAEMLPALASPDIFGMRYNLSVPRIDATAHSAEMIETQSFRDWLAKMLIGNSVRFSELTLQVEGAIPATIVSSRP